MQQQPHRALWINEIKQKQKKSHIQTDHSIFDLAYKQCNDIIKGTLMQIWKSYMFVFI